MRQVISPQVDGLALLRDLVELVKDPQRIIEAQELALASFTLTQDERLKADDARKSIKESAEILSSIEAQKLELISSNEQTAKAIAELSAKQMVFAENVKTVNEKEVLLEKKEAEILRLQKSLTELKKELTDQETWCIEEKTRLADMNKDIKIRLQKVEMREKAADL